MSSHGERRDSGAGSSGVWKTRRAHSICDQVIPDFAGVLMMMSPVRSLKSSQRELSLSSVRYTGAAAVTVRPTPA